MTLRNSVNCMTWTIFHTHTHAHFDLLFGFCSLSLSRFWKREISKARDFSQINVPFSLKVTSKINSIHTLDVKRESKTQMMGIKWNTILWCHFLFCNICWWTTFNVQTHFERFLLGMSVNKVSISYFMRRFKHKLHYQYKVLSYIPQILNIYSGANQIRQLFYYQKVK